MKRDNDRVEPLIEALAEALIAACRASLTTPKRVNAPDPATANVALILEFMGLRPPYRLDLTAGKPLDRADPRWKVFEAQLTYILNTGGLMFVLTPLPLKPVRTATSGALLILESRSVSAIRFQGGRWFPIPADQIDALFERPPESGPGTVWLFRDFPRL